METFLYVSIALIVGLIVGVAIGVKWTSWAVVQSFDVRLKVDPSVGLPKT